MVHQLSSNRQNSEKNSVYQKFSLPNFTLHQKYMHAILVGRKIYALDMPSNFIFTHRRWLMGSGGEVEQTR